MDLATKITTTALLAFVCVVANSFVTGAARAVAQADVKEADLVVASGSHTIALRPAAGGPIEQVPLEVYVARVLAGEGEPNAPEATQQALAIVIRTFAVVNAGRHRREGFDLCDSTHCQVPRPATAASRRAALATAGRILTYQGHPAEVFYSASCGGRSEAASAVWPKADLPYLRSIKDNVHRDDVPWTYQIELGDVQRILQQNGFEGKLKNVQIASRSNSGRAAALELSGMHPDRIPGDQFRAILGNADLRSTAFSVKKKGRMLYFKGTGYGHGVGMCVIGAGRRARRGESTTDILKTYYPGLKIERFL